MIELEELERQVVEKWVNVAADRAPRWELPDDIPFNLDEWAINSVQLPSDWPQFPREQWLVYPTKRRLTLIICDVALDRDLTDDEWIHVCLLMMYGGKERVA